MLTEASAPRRGFLFLKKAESRIGRFERLRIKLTLAFYV